MKFTREDLLQKGVDPAVADEIVSALADSTDAPLAALEKALNGDEPTDTLIKASHVEPDDDDKGKKGEKDGDDDDYDEKYMKKYMKKFMKDNKESCKKAAEEAELFGKDMKKAMDNIDRNSEGAVVEMEDLSSYLKAQTSFNEALLKAVVSISSTVETISAQEMETYGLMHKAAAVQLQTSTVLEKALSIPTGRKAVIADVNMVKAQSVSSTADVALVYKVLAKAISNKDLRAGAIAEVFEVSGKNMNALNPMQKAYVQELIEKEGK
jgi:hypothetical protein